MFSNIILFSYDRRERLINLTAQLIDRTMQSIDFTINLILIKHYNFESKIQRMLPIRDMILTCLALSQSTTKFQQTKVVFQTLKTQACSHPQIVQHSGQYVFFGIFLCCEQTRRRQTKHAMRVCFPHL